MKVIILAGGSGTRLWPLSRKNYPKQFLKINGDRSLLQQTAERLNKMVLPEDFIVMTNSDYKFHVKSDLDFLPLSHMILEPAGRNTAPAIALGIKYCLERLGCDKDEVIFVSPSDHIIRPAETFLEYIRQAEAIAKEGYIVTFGIEPARPETGYGYIKAGKGIEKGIEKGKGKDKNKDKNKGKGIGTDKDKSKDIECYMVEQFAEKPDADTAARYLQEGNYYWNSGMFAFSIGTMLEEFHRHAPEISGMLEKGFDEMLSDFMNMSDISIDYAVAEKSDRVVTLPMVYTGTT